MSHLLNLLLTVHVGNQQVTAIFVKRGASIYRASLPVDAHCFVTILVQTPVSVPAHLVQHPAVTTAITKDAR